jgi:transposase
VPASAAKNAACWQPPLPPQIIEKSLVGGRVIVDAIVSKYSNHCPLYRQSAIFFLRDAGLDISRATIDGWVMRAGDLLTPLAGVMRKELLEGTYIQADETPVDVQTRDGRSSNHPGYLWQYGTPGGAPIFEFGMGRGREGPMCFLEHFAGILQTDAYAAYDRVGGSKMVYAACWAHARRCFVEAVKLHPQDIVSTGIVALIAKLFAIQARDENMDHAARYTLRMQRAPLVLAELKAQMQAASRTALPSSPLGKACSYTLRLWDKLTRLLDYPELELSTNLAENSMRPVAIGRRNWTHIGHQKADHESPRSSPSSKPAADSGSRSVSTSPPSCPGLPAHPSSDCHNSLPPPGPKSIHRACCAARG